LLDTVAGTPVAAEVESVQLLVLEGVYDRDVVRREVEREFMAVEAGAGAEATSPAADIAAAGMEAAGRLE
jgi:hypothetical protein